MSDTQQHQPADDGTDLDDVEEQNDDRFVRTHIEGASGGTRPRGGQQGPTRGTQ